VFFTFALGTPDIPRDVLSKMEEKRLGMFKDIKDTKINPFSRLQWANRAKIYKFTSAQTENEKNLEKELKVQAKRNKSTRCIMTLIKKTPNKKLVSYIYLRRVFNDVYAKKINFNSFNIMSGLFNAELEAKIIPGGKGIFEYWQSHMDDFVIFPNQNKKNVLKWMQENSINKTIIERYSKSHKLWLFPIGMKKNQAWFEVDPESYRMVSVLSNGLYGSMTEEDILETINNIAQYGAGLFWGVGISEFTVLAYSLKYPDYCSIIKAAEGAANQVACAVAAGQFATSIKDSTIYDNVAGGLGTGLGCAGQGGASKAVSWAVALEKTSVDGAKGLSGAIGGFANGFGDGVSLYFMGAKMHGNCK